MILTLLQGYPDRIGRRFAFVGYGTGPTSYSQTTSDPVTIQGFQNQIDVIHGGQSVSGTYTVRAYLSAVGVRPTWKLKWITTSTGVEVSNGTNLSAETVQLGGFGGTY
jgi:hypothetical protein